MGDDSGSLSSDARPVDARCAVHPERSASTTCTRCGDYACLDCTGNTGAGLCSACRARAENVIPKWPALYHLFFGFSGRIGRLEYWRGYTGIWFTILVVMVGAALLGGTGPDDLYTLLFWPLTAVGTWAWLAVSIKRWHDHDKSASWMLIGFVPIIGGPWMFVECGLLRGTIGANRYGEDPVPLPRTEPPR
jgi:uncharacterized membrane protein YhaH (DUF805 family)